jgi:hypothetical protein
MDILVYEKNQESSNKKIEKCIGAMKPDDK